MECQLKGCSELATFRINRQFVFCEQHYDNLFVNISPEKEIVWITERIKSNE